MRCLLFLLAVMLCPVGFAEAPAVQLKADQALTVTGTLMMRPGGRLQFVTVKTAATYVSPVGNKPVHEIAVGNNHDYALLYAHRGETVTVMGKVWTNDASPYYRDGMVLMAEHIVTRGGVDLIGSSPKVERVAVDVGLYRATAILPADLAAPWRYQVNGTPDTRRMLSCSSNGGGDVVNCSCAEGFRVTQVGPGGELMGSDAQFAVGDEAKAAELSVTCSR